MRLATVIALASAVMAAGMPAAQAAPALPGSMAAIGDSITRATDVCCSYGDHPSHSWSTGSASGDGIKSHYERILARNPAISGHNANDAAAGAKMRDAAGQAKTAVTQKAKYVTILMGANDVCTSSPGTMTSVSTFRTQFSSAMSTLHAGLPAGAHVFVSSIPNIYRLWQLFHTNSSAELVWSLAGICQSMLSTSNTEATRQSVLSREEAFNKVLSDVCALYAFCRFDGNATFNYAFTTSDVSKLDYFHPSLAGQGHLASVTWQHSWWPAL
jgi:lysophospholipase L1-like esterase